MMKFAAILILIFGSATARADHHTDEEALIAVLDEFSLHLHNLDAASARQIMEEKGTIIYVIVNEEEGTTNFLPLSISEYLLRWTGMASNPDMGVIEEVMFNPEIQVHGAIASVWIDYNLIIDGELVQCGKNGFQFIKKDSGWKIANAVSTFEHVGCEAR